MTARVKAGRPKFVEPNPVRCYSMRSSAVRVRRRACSDSVVVGVRGAGAPHSERPAPATGTGLEASVPVRAVYSEATLSGRMALMMATTIDTSRAPRMAQPKLSMLKGRSNFLATQAVR